MCEVEGSLLVKNIVFLTYLNQWSMDNGKGAPSFHKTIEAYIQSGWKVTLISPDFGVETTPELAGLNHLSFKPIFLSLTKIKGVSFFGRLLHAIQGELCLLRLAQQVVRRAEGAVIVYAYEVHGVKAGKRLAKEHQLPLVTRFQGTVLAPIPATLLNRIRKYPHFSALATKADLTIMTDDGTQGDQVLKRLNNRSTLVKFWRNGVDVSREAIKSTDLAVNLRTALKLEDTDRILLTVSRLAGWKRVDRAIVALAEIARQRDDVKLVIVGDGDEKENLQQLAKKLGVAQFVRFVGAVKQSDVRQYLEVADVFLSLYDLSNVGNPLLEAMACGKPIITLDVGDTRTLIHNEHNGFLMEVHELNKLPSKIEQLLDDQTIAQRLGTQAKITAEQAFWSWEARMKAEVELIDQLYHQYFESDARVESTH